jgi:hypothetical protein
VQSTDMGCSICESVTEIPKAECEALVSLYETTDGDHWTNNDGWLQTSTPCTDWNGIACNGGFITELNLDHNQLKENIPRQLSALTELRRCAVLI